MRPRSIVRSVIRFRSNTIGTRLNVPSVHLPVRCTFSCPSHVDTSFRQLSFTGYAGLAFRRPSAGHFHGLSLTCRTVCQNKGVPYVIGTTGRIIITSFLGSNVDFLNVDSIVRGAVRRTTFITGPDCRSCMTASRRTEEVTSRLIHQRGPRGWFMVDGLWVVGVRAFLVHTLRLVVDLSLLIVVRRNKRFLFTHLFGIQIRGFYLFFSP